MEIADLRASSAAGGDAKATPYSEVWVTLSKQEHIELVCAASYWKIEHRRAAERALSIAAVYEERLRQAAQREAQLGAELEVAQAKIRDLQQRMFGRKSERRKGGSEQQAQAWVSRAPRGHQRGVPGHGRTLLSHLPGRIEWVELTRRNVRVAAWR